MESIKKLMTAIEQLVPEYLANPIDKNTTGGNWAYCIIDENGVVNGKVGGVTKVQGRQTFKIAWTKASQVWITGYRTGEYEKLAFTGQIDERQFGIIRPDYIGWEGGQPVTLKDGTKLAVGFSGFRGVSDVEIVERALLNSGL